MEIRVRHGETGHRDCVSRRGFLRAGTLGLGGLGLADLLRQEASATQAGEKGGKGLSVIVLWQAGGPPT